MVFCSFMRHKCCPVHLQFFQSSATYLNNQALTKFYQNYTRVYNGDGPHPSQHSRRFLSIDTGHYGLYYTIFNRDTDKHRSKQINVIQFHPLNLHLPHEVPKFKKFHILGLNQEIYNNIRDLKLKSKLSLSTSSLFFSRKFSSKASPVVSSFESHEGQETPTDKRVLEAEFDENDYDLSRFKSSQVNKINELYESHNDNIALIFPVYQSLTRNNLSLPSIDMYNKVLRSIINRDLNNTLNIEDIEIKLTNLLTVYQDLLAVATEDMKPNNETFNIIVNGLLDGCLNSMKYYQQPNLPAILYNEAYVKSQEFSVITLELLLSIKNFQQLSLDVIYPKVFKVLNTFPNLSNRDLLLLIFNNLIKNSREFDYYDQLIQLTNQFQHFDILTSNKACYDFVLHVFDNYKQVAGMEDLELFSINDDYALYKTLVVELIKTNNLEVSTKYLDSILLEFKKNYTKDLKPGVSQILSHYLIEFSSHDLDQSYNLLIEFNKLNFIPELSMDLYNNLIDKFVHKYYHLESIKNESNIDQMNAEQQQLYNNIWYLTDYNLIRKDYTVNSNVINLSLDLNDSDSIFKLTKIMLINNDLLMDIPILKKLLAYYQNGLAYNFNNYYEVLVNVVSQQAEIYKSHGKLNDFFSEVINYLIVPNGANSNVGFKKLINTFLVKDVFHSFDLINDKIYGLIKFSKFLINYTNSNQDSISQKDLQKVLYYQSLLINEFENPEIAYVSLDEDLTLFKQNLIDNFKQFYGQVDQYTESMIDTLNVLQLPLPTEMSIDPNPPALEIDLNLLLNINYSVGIDQFISLFNQGYMFNYDTLLITINKGFLLNHMKKIHNFNRFINNVIAVDTQNHDLLKILINENIDKININILKNYQLEDLKLVDMFLNNLQTSSNKYLYNLFKLQAMGLLDHLNALKMAKFLKVLQAHNDFEEVDRIFVNNSELSAAILTNESLLAVYLQNLLMMNQFEKFNEITRSQFKDQESVRVILKNEELMALINDYYVANNYPTKFFNGKSFTKTQVAKLCTEVFNQLLNPQNLTVLYKMNRALINLNQQVIMNYILTKLNQLQLSFTKILSVCSIFNIQKLSMKNLNLLLENLTILKDKNNLTIIFNQFLSPSKGGEGLSNYIKFNSWEFLLNDNHGMQNKLSLLKSFEYSFQSLNDEINLSKLKRFCEQHNLNI